MGIFDWLNRATGGLGEANQKGIDALCNKGIIDDLGLHAERIARSAYSGPEAVDEAYAAFDAKIDDALEHIKHEKMKDGIEYFRTVNQSVARDAKQAQWVWDPRSGMTQVSVDPNTAFGASQDRVDPSLNKLWADYNQYLNPNKNRQNFDEFIPGTNQRYYAPDNQKDNNTQPQWNADGTYRG
jgi:hypothetical protein